MGNQRGGISIFESCAAAKNSTCFKKHGKSSKVAEGGGGRKAVSTQ